VRGRCRDDISEADTPTRRLRAVSAFLLAREPLLLELAGHALDPEAVFESAVRGSSMSPAIPASSRIRVRLLGDRACRRGDVVYYRADRGYVVHRVAYRERRGSPTSYLITRGDNCLAPDPPVQRRAILGTVVAIHAVEGWRDPSPLTSGSVWHRAVRAATLSTTILAFWFGAAPARRVARAFARLESVARAPAGRVLRRLGLTSS